MFPKFPTMNIPVFGPNANFDISNNFEIEEDLRKTSFVLAITKDLKKMDSIPETIYKKDFWKDEKHKLKTIDNNQNLKFISSVHSSNYFRYMYYNTYLKKSIRIIEVLK